MAIDFTQNYFEVFELECSNKVEIAKLEKKYLIFQKEFLNHLNKNKKSLEFIFQVEILFFQIN